MDTLQRTLDVIMQNSPLAWWEWDVSDNRVVFNDLKVTSLGYDPKNFRDRGYEAFTSLLHPEDYSKAMSAMEELLWGQKDIYQVDYRIRDIEGCFHWYLDRGAAIGRNDDVITRVRGLVIDLGLESGMGANTEALVGLLERYALNPDNKLTICSSCKRIKLTNREWTVVTGQLEAGFMDALSHGICPDCVRLLYPERAERVLAKIG